MPVVIHPASLASDASGTPFSEKFADVYHSAGAGPEQARHVFLHGNDLPTRWARRRAFTIVETGFGIGLNFLATWAAWRGDPARCERLHFVSIERYPFVREDLATLHARYREFSELSGAMLTAWPLPIAGTHRLHLDRGAVTLTLVFADVLDALADSRLGADAFYLDGFAPERNPEMWSPSVMKALARLARPDATLATYTTARTVRDALAGAGFAVEKAAGLAPKRRMLRGRFAPRWPLRHGAPLGIEWPERKALIVGAGVAGSAVAERLASRGWQVEILERNVESTRGASQLTAGVTQPHLSSDDCALSRFTRAGFLYAQRRLGGDDGAEGDMACSSRRGDSTRTRSPCGVLQLADDVDHERRMGDALATLAYPAAYAQAISRQDAGIRAGRSVAMGGWWIPMGDWARPGDVVAATVARAFAEAPSMRARFGREVAALRRIGEQWSAIDASGAEIDRAPVVILANACDAGGLVDIAPLELQRIAGQLTILPPGSSAPHVVVCGHGYVLPEIDGRVITGASYDPSEPIDSASHVQARHAGNLRRAERLLPGIAAGVDAAALREESGVRCIAPDRMPMVGALVDMDRARYAAESLTGAHLSDIPRLPGLFCAIALASRGLTWSELAAECLASRIEGEPLPVEGALADAIDPGRFAVKYARRGLLR